MHQPLRSRNSRGLTLVGCMISPTWSFSKRQSTHVGRGAEGTMLLPRSSHVGITRENPLHILLRRKPYRTIQCTKTQRVAFLRFPPSIFRPIFSFRGVLYTRTEETGGAYQQLAGRAFQHTVRAVQPMCGLHHSGATTQQERNEITRSEAVLQIRYRCQISN